jgi:DNA (cytosine-5)-methyltransferase 1
MQHFIRLVSELQPKYFIMANVKGLTVGKHKQLLDEVILQFESNGYKVKTDYQVLNAACFGVPQERHRVFIYGCRQEMILPEYPAFSTLPARRAPLGSTGNFQLPPSPTVMAVLCDLPDVDRFEDLIYGDSISVDLGEPSTYSEKLRGFGDDDNFGWPRHWDRGLLTTSMRTIHTRDSARRFAETANGETEPISRFPKLLAEGICNTLRAGTGSDRGAYTSPRPIHPFCPRCITVREAARLHSYPDWFRFHQTKWHGFRQIGNSVPPLLARSVARQVAKALGCRPERPTEQIKLGSEALLKFNMTEAAHHFGVSPGVAGKRERVSEISKGHRGSLHVNNATSKQLSLAEV